MRLWSKTQVQEFHVRLDAVNRLWINSKLDWSLQPLSEILSVSASDAFVQVTRATEDSRSKQVLQNVSKNQPTCISNVLEAFNTKF